MTRPGKRAGVLALLAALLIGTPVSAGDSDTYKQNLRDQIRELREELANLRRLRELDSKMTNTELKLMAARLDRIEKALARLASSSTNQDRTARFYDPATTGTIRLDNRLAVTATVNIDGVDYSVPARSTTTLRGQPLGTISYTVTADGYGVRPAKRTPVRANETLVVTVY